ncbi:hypothetical protein G7046_g2877 [Stylonectria norvegica]|nr:hypothetical protein G7046_g2877 [Stylonectria norvegica]
MAAVAPPRLLTWTVSASDFSRKLHAKKFVDYNISRHFFPSSQRPLRSLDYLTARTAARTLRDCDLQGTHVLSRTDVADATPNDVWIPGVTALEPAERFVNGSPGESLVRIITLAFAVAVHLTHTFAPFIVPAHASSGAGNVHQPVAQRYRRGRP